MSECRGLATVLILLAAACTEPSRRTPLVIAPGDTTIEFAERLFLRVSAPSDPARPLDPFSLDFASSDPNVAGVGTSGDVMGRGAGTATVTARRKRGGGVAELRVHVDARRVAIDSLPRDTLEAGTR